MIGDWRMVIFHFTFQMDYLHCLMIGEIIFFVNLDPIVYGVSSVLSIFTGRKSLKYDSTCWVRTHICCRQVPVDPAKTLKNCYGTSRRKTIGMDFSSWLASNHKNSTKCPITHEILDKYVGILTMAYYNPFFKWPVCYPTQITRDPGSQVMLVMFLQGAARFGASWLACAAAAKISATACWGQLRPPQSQARVYHIHGRFLWFFCWDKSESSTFPISWINSLLVDFGWRNKSGVFFPLGVPAKPLPNICNISLQMQSFVLRIPWTYDPPTKTTSSDIKGSLFQMVKQKRLNSWSCLVLWILKQMRLEKNMCCIVEICFCTVSYKTQR